MEGGELMKKLVLNVNLAAPVNLVGRVLGFVVKPVVALEKHIAIESANAALAQMMESDEGKLALFNMLLAAGKPAEKVTE
jgi:hypothetical protein